MHVVHANSELPKGIHRRWSLPEKALGALWDSIIIDEQRKDQLLSQAVVNFTVRGKVDRSILPLHGIILLVGEPGTGKTSLARGLAHRVAESFKAPMQLLEVEPHSLMSGMHGKTQRAVMELFSQSIHEAAMTKPTIVLLDEVETLAADRSSLSFDTNPVDVHRATDAVLVQLDLLADRNPNLLFVATSNFPAAVDDAFMSRCDLIMEVPLPDQDACGRILKDCLEGLGETFPGIGKLTASPLFAKCAAACVGLDGRAIRKMVGSAIATRPQTAIDPNSITIDDIMAAANYAKAGRQQGAAGE